MPPSPLRDSDELARARAELRQEIARREQAEEALWRTREQLRLVADSAPVLLARCDRDCRYLFVNRAYAARFGLHPRDIVGRTIAEVIGPEAFASIRPRVDAVLRGETSEFEVEVPYARLGRRVMHCTYAPDADAAGGVRGWVAVIVDVTQRQEMEAALRQSESRFRQLADLMPQLAWIARPDGHIDWYNQRWYEYTGTTLEQMAGWGWQSVHDPAELPAVLERWQASIATGQPFDMVFPLRGRDGRFRPFLTRVIPLKDEAGRILHWFGTNTDISEIMATEAALRESNQALRLLTETANDLLTVDDSQQFVRQVYGRLKAPLGLDVCFNYMAVEGEPRMRLDFYDGVPPEVAEGIRHLRHGEAVCGCVAVEQRRIVAEDIAHSADPRAALVRGLGVQAYACHPLLVQGRFIGTLSFGTRRRPRFSDEELGLMAAVATQVAAAMERLRLIETLRHRAEQLAEADRRKDEFLAMLGHELRNPLAAIRNGLHVLALSDGDGGLVAQVQALVGRQTDNLARMVDDLLDVSRITRGTIALRKQVVDLAAAVGHAVESARPLIDSRGHALTVQLPPRPVRLEADPTRLEQVVVNLLNNAARYTPPGGTVALTAERAGDEAVIRVRDNGIGIRADLLPKVFDLFVQSEQPLDRAQGGLGIGLTLVRQVVELHGGRVEASSGGAGRGSEFTVRLPALPGAADGPASAGAPAADAAGGPARVLVVEDMEDVARSLRMLLELWGYDVRVVSDGPAALPAYRDFRPDVVLLDIGLPGMDGYEVARQIRREPGGGRPFILAVTGYGQDEDKRRAREAGFDEHMTKPIDPDELRARLAAVPGLVGA